MNKTSVVTEEKLAALDELFKKNNWSMIVGQSIEDCLMCDGLKSITVHNKPNEEGFVMSVLYNQKLLKKFYDIDEVLSDALLTYFIQEYYEI